MTNLVGPRFFRPRRPTSCRIAARPDDQERRRVPPAERSRTDALRLSRLLRPGRPLRERGRGGDLYPRGYAGVFRRRNGSEPMRYACLVYFDQDGLFANEAEVETCIREGQAFNDDLAARGHLVVSHALAATAEAVSARVRE